MLASHLLLRKKFSCGQYTLTSLEASYDYRLIQNVKCKHQHRSSCGTKGFLGPKGSGVKTPKADRLTASLSSPSWPMRLWKI